VDAALATSVAVYEESRRRVEMLDAVCDHLSARVIDREQDLADARLELRRMHRVTDLTRRPAESRERLLAALHEAIERIGADEDDARPEPAPLRPVGDVFDGRVEIEVGPFHDFSQLVGFEDAAGAITATSQISVTRFARGRATLEMRLSEPVELLRELEERSPFHFAVRDQRADRVVLDVPAPGAEAA